MVSNMPVGVLTMGLELLLTSGSIASLARDGAPGGRIPMLPITGRQLGSWEFL